MATRAPVCSGTEENDKYSHVSIRPVLDATRDSLRMGTINERHSGIFINFPGLWRFSSAVDPASPVAAGKEGKNEGARVR